MSKNKIMIMAAAVLVAASCAAPAWADPNGTGSGGAPIGEIGTGSGGAPVGSIGVRDSGAPIGAIGTGGPDFSTPVSIPSVGPAPEKPGPGATPAELKAYERAVAEHRSQVQARENALALEWARQQAIAARQAPSANDEGE